VPAVATLFGVLTTFSADSGRDAAVVMVTALAGGGLATWALLAGALRLRVRGPGINWPQLGSGLVGIYLASAALSGWTFAASPGFFVTGSQSINGALIGCAVYAFGSHLRRHN